ncbi:MAG: hypothetical protein Kow00109_06150 [Acidobacteriota bacterium]
MNERHVLLELLCESETFPMYCESLRRLESKFELNAELLFQLSAMVQRRVSPYPASERSSLAYRTLRVALSAYVLQDLSADERAAWWRLLDETATDSPVAESHPPGFLPSIRARLREVRRYIEEMPAGLEKEALAGGFTSLLTRMELHDRLSKRKEESPNDDR